jgi:hypothetical protein
MQSNGPPSADGGYGEEITAGSQPPLAKSRSNILRRAEDASPRVLRLCATDGRLGPPVLRPHQPAAVRPGFLLDRMKKPDARASRPMKSCGPPSPDGGYEEQLRTGSRLRPPVPLLRRAEVDTTARRYNEEHGSQPASIDFFVPWCLRVDHSPGQYPQTGVCGSGDTDVFFCELRSFRSESTSHARFGRRRVVDPRASATLRLCVSWSCSGRSQRRGAETRRRGDATRTTQWLPVRRSTLRVES